MPPSPVVDFNHAVAIGMAYGPRAALPLVEAVAGTGRPDGHHLPHAARAELLRRAGQAARARGSNLTALDLAPTEAERRHLRNRLAAL